MLALLEFSFNHSTILHQVRLQGIQYVLHWREGEDGDEGKGRRMGRRGEERERERGEREGDGEKRRGKGEREVERKGRGKKNREGDRDRGIIIPTSYHRTSLTSL